MNDRDEAAEQAPSDGPVADNPAPNDAEANGAGTESDAGSGSGSPSTSATFTGETAEEQLDECAQLVEAISTERDDMRGVAQRVQADFENYKRRVEAQRAEQQNRAAEDLVQSLLEILDDCDLAAAHGADDVAPIANKLLSTLERQGLTKVDDTEVLFDPNLHEAVMSEEGDGDGEHTVSAVMRAGYQWRDRLLRPAMVKVRS